MIFAICSYHRSSRQRRSCNFAVAQTKSARMVGMEHGSSSDKSVQSARRMYDTFYRQHVEF